MKHKYLDVDVNVARMHRDNTLPAEITAPLYGQVVNTPELGQVYLSSNGVDYRFSRAKDLHLASTYQLVCLRKKVILDSETAKELAQLMDLTIESRPDVTLVLDRISKGLEEFDELV